MKHSIKNRLKMYEAVRSTCGENQNAWEGIPAFVSAVSQFDTRLSALKDLSFEHAKDLTFLASGKKALMDKCLAKALDMNKILISFATNTGNETMKDRISTSKRDFIKGGEQDKINRIGRVIEDLTANLPALAEYGVSNADLDDLNTMKAELLNKIAAPRVAIINRTQKTESMNEIVTFLDSILKIHVDSLMLILKPTHPEFYFKYKDARSVIAYGTKHNKPGEAPSEPDDGGGE